MTHLNVGGHVSLGGKSRQAVESLAADGFTSMQIFASSPGAWKPPVVDERRSEEFVSARREFGVSPLVIHSIYLINLASADPLLVRRSRSSLVATLDVAAIVEAQGVVTHIGSHAGLGFDAVSDRVAEGLLDVLDQSSDSADLIMENSAGAGAILGAELWELSTLIHKTGNHPRLKVALDTAHLCASGWDFTQPRAAERLVDDIERTVGLERLTVIHCNDSLKPCGSRRDRHARIGEGHIGLEGFRHLLAQPALRGLPWILETPDLERRSEEAESLQHLAAETAAIGTACAS